MKQISVGGIFSLCLFASMVIGVFAASTALAETSKSSNYQVTQTELGGSSDLQTCSGQYCAQSSAGGTVGGDTAGNVYHTKLGDVTSSEPALDVTVDGDSTSLGTLTTDRTATKTMSIKVRNYLSNGYIVQIVGDAPSYAGHTLAALASPTASQPGKEQFGMNAVKNTTPNIGADPVQVPSNDISYGIVADDYKTADKFMYLNGDIVALSHTASGETDYTITMIVNVSATTPAGQYSGDFSAVVVPVY